MTKIQAAIGVRNAVKSVAEGVNPTVKGTVEVVKGASEDDNQTVKRIDAAYEESLVADEKQVKTGEVATVQQVNNFVGH